ncbi:APC family permease [[Mycoplasma] gypis]|uniref:APC family permease n=1 Tax=[Mycoplasma] gypis TaxID=92404 RepID=A0ABZ2RM99_9BACT|nr:APC family permease [[Mycoplasma] gypis]MBN0919143.1 APC family permease [[Mycoplasma] gypis]
MSEEQLVVTSDKKKKITFFSAILIVIGSSVGAGIFLRSSGVLEESQGNIFWSIFAWLLAAFAVVTMAIALVEVASGRNDNLGMIGWNKAFNGLYIYKACKWFMTFLYLPFTYYFMPLYVIIQMQDAASGFHDGAGNLINNGLGNKDWIIMMVLAIGISLWFFLTSGLSSYAGNIQNWVVTVVKFIPLIAVVILGMLFAGQTLSETPDGSSVSVGKQMTQITWWNKESTSLATLSPIFGIFTSMAAIFFAYDGFYVTAGVQSEMAEPKKTPLALIIGLSTVTAIYLIVAVSMTVGAAKGGFYGFADLLSGAKAGWLFGLINMCISIGILGIINGFTMWATRFVEDLIKEGELWVPLKAYKYMQNSKAPVVGMVFSMILTLPVVLLFNVVGSLAYFPGGYDGLYGSHEFNSNLNFADLMANWMAVIAFAFIVMSIIGAIKNRKQHFIKVEEGKHTIWAGITGSVLVALALVIYALNPYVSLGLIKSQQDAQQAALAAMQPGAQYITPDQWNEVNDKIESLNYEFIGRLVTSILLPVFAIFMFAMVPVEKLIVYKKQRKYEMLLSENIDAEQKQKLLELQAFNNARIQSFVTAR